MFGRRRHAAALAAARVPQLTQTQVLELVTTRLSAFLGSEGEWSVSRRRDEDTDAIFQDVLTRSIAIGITEAIADAQKRLEAGEQPEPALHLAPAQPAEVDSSEPVAFGWEPAPITKWADLRRPVTGEIPLVEREHALVA